MIGSTPNINNGNNFLSHGSPGYQQYLHSPQLSSGHNNNNNNNNNNNSNSNNNNNQYQGSDNSENYSTYPIDDFSTNSYLNEDPLKNSLPLLEHLELSVFKIHPCNNMQSHNHKQCKFYHSQKDRRRGNIQYISDICEYAEQDPKNCPLGDKCPKAHNKVEQLYSPDKYKTKYCTLFPKNCANCEYGPYCSFAHSENDITIELIHHYEYDDDFYIFYYKTVWCPFNFLPHDRGHCVYAHNWQDYRRKPNQYKYDQLACQHWKPDIFITKYEDGCENQYNCNKCHGWKELEYHPLNYRTKPCSSGQSCNKGRACPYYHNQAEKRLLPQNIQSKLFRLAPRNRLIQNLYKNSHEMLPQQPVANKQNKPKTRHSDKMNRDIQQQLMKTQTMLLKKSNTQDFENNNNQEPPLSDEDSTDENYYKYQKKSSDVKRNSTRKSINLNAQSYNPNPNSQIFVGVLNIQKEYFENPVRENSVENSPQMLSQYDLMQQVQNDKLVEGMVNNILD